MHGLTPIPTRARRSTWRRIRAELVLQGLAVHLEPDRSALPRGRLLAGKLALALPNDERLLLIPWTEPDGSLHGKTLRCLVSGRWRGNGRAEQGDETRTLVADRVPARILLRDVERTADRQTLADLLISPRDNMTVTMFTCLEATLKRTCPIVTADDVIDHLRRFSEPSGWPAWIPNDEAAPQRTAPAVPPGIDRDVWSAIATVVVEVFALEDDQVRFDVTIESIQGDSLDGVQVIMALEERFGVDFYDDELDSVFAPQRTLGDVYHAVLAKRKERG